MKASHHRRDGNHQEIADALRAAGWRVRSLSMVGNGMADLVALRGGILKFIEVKQAKGKIRPAQEQFRAEGWPVETIRTIEEAAKL